MSIPTQRPSDKPQVSNEEQITLNDSDIEVTVTAPTSPPPAARSADDSWAVNGQNQQNYQNN
jgi:hypothetical protein